MQKCHPCSAQYPDYFPRIAISDGEEERKRLMIVMIEAIPRSEIESPTFPVLLLKPLIESSKFIVGMADEILKEKIDLSVLFPELDFSEDAAAFDIKFECSTSDDLGLAISTAKFLVRYFERIAPLESRGSESSMASKRQICFPLLPEFPQIIRGVRRIPGSIGYWDFMSRIPRKKEGSFESFFPFGNFEGGMVGGRSLQKEASSAPSPSKESGNRD